MGSPEGKAPSDRRDAMAAKPEQSQAPGNLSLKGDVSLSPVVCRLLRARRRSVMRWRASSRSRSKTTMRRVPVKPEVGNLLPERPVEEN